MDEAMVDRLMWRTGFGPSERDRKRFRGKSLHQAVSLLLAAPQGRLFGPEPHDRGTPLDPNERDDHMILAWLDRMVRTRNALVERLTLMWHDHFATSREMVSPPQLMTRQNELLRRYSDLAAYPTANFRSLIRDIGLDPAMMRWLNNEDNTNEEINENYGRELMELFCLGVVDHRGNPHYSEEDVREVSKALTGWELDDEDPERPRVEFNGSLWFDGNKTVFGEPGNYDYAAINDKVLAHRSHPRFIVTRIWSEFIPTPPDEATVKELMRLYVRARMRFRPLLARILTHPDMLASLREPNMIKPPVVYAAGMMRALGLPITDRTPVSSLQEMGQVPYFPPTVAGWEGGESWLNTNTALARFRLADRLLRLSYEGLPDKEPEDVAGETSGQAFQRAWRAVGKPWLSPGTRSALLYVSRTTKSRDKWQRVARQRALRAFILGGPDGQVM
jgi:uncharacterized protein (DUF1800 family)